METMPFIINWTAMTRRINPIKRWIIRIMDVPSTLIKTSPFLKII